MFRPALRVVGTTAPLLRSLPQRQIAKRFASTAPPRSLSGGLRSFVVRWGLAGAVVYYYNTSSTFADEPRYVKHTPPEMASESETYATIEAVAEQRNAQPRPAAPSPDSQASTLAVPEAAGAMDDSPSALEEEADQQGAFNEETGEINWDCPCLGGMAHGPCGDQFRTAFSCFVYSKDEPKGVDCIEHFKTMQNCFREHPEVYGSELEEDEVADELDGLDAPVGSEPTPSPDSAGSAPLSVGAEPPSHGDKVSELAAGTPESDAAVAGKRERAQAATKQVEAQYQPTSETADLVPKASLDFP